MFISKSKHFDKDNTSWTFYLIGNDYNDYVASKLEDPIEGKANYHNSDGGKVKIWVKRWNEIIQNNKIKLNSLREKLDFNVSENSEGLNYLSEKHGKLFNFEESNKVQ